MQQIYTRTPMPIIEITLRHGCSTVNLLHIFRTPFPRNVSVWLLLHFAISQKCLKNFAEVYITLLEELQIDLKKFYTARLYPAGIYLLKINTSNTRTTCKTCSNLTTGVFIVNFENILHLALVFLFLTLNM